MAGDNVTAVNVRAWYLSLARPPGTPPDWLFGPVWSILYFLMAVAVWLVWRQPEPVRRPALYAWGAQLLLNALWTQVFFGLRLLIPALAVLAALLAAIVFTIIRFRPLDGRAALLMLPYLAWVIYAAYLNTGLCWLNN